MERFDQHLHCHLSFDCQEEMVNYIRADRSHLVFTDHLDLHNPGNGFSDDIPDFDQIIKRQAEFKANYQTNLLLGVEIGYVPGQECKLRQVLALYDFDVKLLSCHHNNQHDYMDPKIWESTSHPIATYFNQMKLALLNFADCQIMTHFDYGLRIHEVSVEELKAYEADLEEIFSLCIEGGLAFELNAKSIYGYGNYALYEYAIPIYQALGGKLFTLGSDAHRAADLESHFGEMQALLRKFGVKETAVFIGGQAHLVPLDPA